MIFITNLTSGHIENQNGLLILFRMEAQATWRTSDGASGVVERSSAGSHPSLMFCSSILWTSHGGGATAGMSPCRPLQLPLEPLFSPRHALPSQPQPEAGTFHLLCQVLGCLLQLWLGHSFVPQEVLDARTNKPPTSTVQKTTDHPATRHSAVYLAYFSFFLSKAASIPPSKGTASSARTTALPAD